MFATFSPEEAFVFIGRFYLDNLLYRWNSGDLTVWKDTDLASITTEQKDSDFRLARDENTGEVTSSATFGGKIDLVSMKTVEEISETKGVYNYISESVYRFTPASAADKDALQKLSVAEPNAILPSEGSATDSSRWINLSCVIVDTKLPGDKIQY